MGKPVEAAVRAYATELVLERRRRKADRDEIHPGDVAVDIEGDIQAQMKLVNRAALCAAIRAFNLS